MSALEIIDQVPEFAKCLVLEMNKLTKPHEDVISTNEAYHRYGRAWVEKWTKMGQLHQICRGNRKTYSISELERVKAKENIAARIVSKK